MKVREFFMDAAQDGHVNMERDVALIALAEKGATLCRLYQWNGPWLSLGRFQDAATVVVPGFLNVVRRPTGGKAVLHGHDLTVALAFPYGGNSVKAAYCQAVQPLLRALRQSELECSLAGDDLAPSASPDCFASSSPYDIVSEANGSKVAGCAMRVCRNAVLLQVSIPYRAPLIEPATAMINPASDSRLDWNWRAFGPALREALG